ncbi:hypothetical protein AVEN_261679-1 [Araneus ventricosus]|uniref:Uncharacterized protein n=1 Tax=Araneus ventricosus TaxID=182803 RepID=A0A4Y2DUL0_ARAVE|nr:hypothetical protein AVEN_261679-1 [Araneus ventricosus]
MSMSRRKFLVLYDSSPMSLTEEESLALYESLIKGSLSERKSLVLPVPTTKCLLVKGHFPNSCSGVPYKMSMSEESPYVC